jgi:hypothetical protein
MTPDLNVLLAASRDHPSCRAQSDMGCRNQVSKPVNVLVIEDVEDDARSVMESLRNSGFEVTYRCVRNGAECGMALACEH